MNLDVNAFNWDSMKEQVGADPFADNSKKFEEDTRFYKLAKDPKTGAGAAVIRFLPDSDRLTIQKVNKINTTVIKDGKKRFVNELSPTTIGLKCPFQDKWAELWNAGNKEESKLFSRTFRYYANIKVIKDPANPENEGKIFLLDMSQTLAGKIQEILEPTPAQVALGKNAQQLFNPLQGHNYTLASAKGANGFINYDGSFVSPDVTSIYESVEAAVNDINENTYKLTEFVQPETFLSYEELDKKLKWVLSQEEEVPSVPEVQAVQAVQQVVQETQAAPEVPSVPSVPEVQNVQQAAPEAQAQAQTQAQTQTQNLDDLLNSLKM